MKTFPFTLIVLVCATLLSTAVQAQDYTYTTNNGTITITGYTGPGGAVTIPSTINGLPVTSIGYEAFYNKSSLTSVTIPNSVTNIGDSAFASCFGLTAINVAATNSAFSSLNGVLFNKNQTTLVEYPGGLAGSYTIPNSVTSIGSWTFWDCTSLTSVTIGNSVTSIGYAAFYYCSSLTSVTIPNSVTSIGDHAFRYCSSLTNVTIGNSVTSIGNYTFQYCSSLTNVTIGNNVTSIGSQAFYDCYSLTNVMIPNSVTSIGSEAFSACSSLTAITVDTNNPAYSSLAGVLFNKNLTSLIQCPAGKVGSYAVPNSVTSIGAASFYMCNSLTNVTIPASVTSIGAASFYMCNSLTNVTIGNSVTSIGYYAFYECYSLTSVTIPNSVTGIGDDAFSMCTSLTNVTIGNSVIFIYPEAFWECFSLTSVYFKGNAPYLPYGGSGVFYRDNNATVYYLAGTTGWGPTFGGRPTMLWNPQVIPAITTQPVSQSIQASSNVTFSITASGTSPLKYQWRFNGNFISAATNASLSRTNVQFANAGGYSVVVTNGYGSVTSGVAQLTVYTNLVLTQTNRAPTTNEIGKPTIPTDPNHFKVFTNGTFQGGVALNPNKMTVVLTHGWKGSPSDWAQYMAQIIQRRIGSNAVNIVAWDWHIVARPQLDVAVQFTQGEGYQLSTDLFTALGANYSQRIHFIGHSLGTLVNAAAANYLQAKGLQANGFSWANMQMTLCDEAEIAWGTTSQDATLATFLALWGNSSTPQPFWGGALPGKCAWADNYISMCGLLHPEAANIILTYEYPQSVPDVNLVYLELDVFHNYSHYFYEDTIEPSIFYNTGGQTNATYAGFICSFEGGGFGGRPATNTYFYQDTVGLELHLVQTNLAFATSFLNARFSSFGTSLGVAYGVGWVFNGIGQAFGAVSGVIQNVGNNVGNMFVNLFTGGGSSSQIQNLKWGPMGGPVPNGGPSPANTPAYAWIPITLPSNTVSMSFDFMLQGNGNNDSFQAALNGMNILSLETILIQTNVLLNTGLIDISQYAGQQVELFLGIVGGTSTNAALTVSNFQFYVTLPPSLQIQLSGANVVLTWPLSGAGYVLQSANRLTPPISWTTVTNVPVIVNFQYTVTNQISSGSVFYRLAIITAPALQAQVSGSNFILLWPASASGYVLETTTNLTATNSWVAVTNTPAAVNQQSVVTNQISGAARFYRLRK